MAGKATESRWTLKDLFTPKVKDAIAVTKEFRETTKATASTVNEFARSESKAASEVLKTKAQLRQQRNEIKQSKKAVSDLAGSLTLASAAIDAAFGAAVGSAIDFQSQMATVGTLVGKTADQLKPMQDQLESLSTVTGKSLSDLAGGLYQTISAGVDAKDSITVLTAASKAAVAGLTDTNTAVDVVTSSLNAYHISADHATQITDTLLKTVQLGKTTFPELAQSMGLVLPSAASLHVSFSDLNSSIAALTLVGLKTPEAISGLNEAFMNILKPSSAAQAEAKKLGIQFTAQALSAKGLIPFLQEIKEKTHGNTQAMSDFFGSIQGLNAMLALTSDNGMKQLISAQKQMQNAAGTTTQQFNIMESTVKNSWNRMVSSVLAQTTKMLMASGVLNAMSTAMNFFTKHSKALTPVLLGLATALAVFVTTLGTYSVAMKVAEIATKAFGGAIKLTPLGVVATLIGIVAAAALWLANNFQTAKLYAMDAWNGIVKGTQWAVNKGVDILNVYVESYRFAFQTIEYAGISIWDGIVQAAQSGINEVLRLISPVSAILRRVGINIPTSVNFSGAVVKTQMPKWDTSNLLQNVDMSGGLYSASQLASQAAKAHAEQNKNVADLTKALNENTKATQNNSQSTDANTSASKANTKALANGGGNMSAEQIADKLMPRLERHLYGT